ncbi:alpha/beta fold hydrolase [Bacillus sp. NP157]|nr:alpha/beta fold hydrolase [Bacillus sp. NP157]
MSSVTTYRTARVIDEESGQGLDIFYREAGPLDAPVVLLLHGFPSSSHQYRGLIRRLADKYRVIAPDLPGFGFSDAPDARTFAYSFKRLARIMEAFTDVLTLGKYALYVFDYGAPTGFRLAVARPERITAIVSQNGNAYEEGLSDGWNPIQAYWKDPSEENRANLRGFLKPETTRFQYQHGEEDTTLIAPESYTLDQHFLDRPGSDDIQLDLFGDYKSNVAAYPVFHSYFREHAPPLLAVWGRNDPFFLPAGAEAFRRDLPHADVRFVDGGHFPLESHLDEVAGIILPFLARHLDTAQGRALFGETGPQSAAPEARPYLDGLAGVFGFVPALGYAIAVEPSVLGAYAGMLQALGATSLDPIAQQVAMVAASHANAAGYGVAVHSTLAKKLGANESTVKALREGSPLDDVKWEAVRQFATAIATKRTQVSDSDVRALTSAGYDKRAAVAIALAAASKTLVNTVAHLSRPAVDPGFQA